MNIYNKLEKSKSKMLGLFGSTVEIGTGSFTALISQHNISENLGDIGYIPEYDASITLYQSDLPMENIHIGTLIHTQIKNKTLHYRVSKISTSPISPTYTCECRAENTKINL